jgi:hypothetical protein
MSKPRREYHPKRTAKAVREHQATMAALAPSKPAKFMPRTGLYGTKHEFYDQAKDK